MFGTRHEDLTPEARSQLPGEFVELSAGFTHYELRGDVEADTVVLIHGNAAPLATWDRTIGSLCDAGFRVLRYDLFGHGFSDRPDLPTYDRDFYNTQLADLLEQLGVARPVRLVGSSQGGSIAACFAADHPGVASRIALVAPLFDDFAESDSMLFRLLTTPRIGEVLLQLVGDRKLADLSDAVASPQARAALQPRANEQYRFRGKRRATLANARGGSLGDTASCYRRLKDQELPVLLAYGTLDETIPRESMSRLRELLPSIEYHEIEGAGHLAHYESPDRVNALLVEFLQR